MLHATRALSLALLAAFVLPGCQAALPTKPVRPTVKAPVAAKAGAVKVSFPGLAPKAGTFRTLATRADIDVVELTLSTGTTNQLRRLSRSELWVPLVMVEFSQVAAGPIRFNVVAYDASGRLIGEASQDSSVSARETTHLNLSVQLAPDTGSGDVTATIDFIDGQPCGAAAFQAADRDGDGRLDRYEFRGGYPFVTDCGLLPEPIAYGTPTPSFTTASGEAVAVSPRALQLKCMPMPMPSPVPPVNAADEQFQALDRNQDDALDLDEFLGVAPPPVDPCEDGFRALDANNDNQLTFKEWRLGRPVPMIARAEAWLGRPDFIRDDARAEFDALDLNHDGLLYQAEHCGYAVAPTEGPVTWR